MGLKLFLNHKHSSLLSMLICLTVLFVFAQISLFFIYYNVSELIDSLATTSIALQLLHFVVLFPILKFIAIQIIAYVLFIGWIWFVAISIGELFKFSSFKTYWVGLLFWCLASITLLSLNQYKFPNSFFAKRLAAVNLFEHHLQIILILGSSVLLVATLIAYFNFFWCKRYHKIGWVLLLLGLSFSAIALYEKTIYLFYHSSRTVTNTKPNIILLGLDSLRPDFTGYSGAHKTFTPHIDDFLQNALYFNQAYTPLARTFPAWISILTAKYPIHNDARNNLVDPALVIANLTLAKHLQQAGYETIYATDENRFSNITKDYGFDRILGPSMGANDFLLGGLSDFPMSNLLVTLPGGRFLFPFNYGNRAAAITYEPNHFLQLVRTGLAQRSNKPLFLALHLCLAHWPYTWADGSQAQDAYLPNQYRNSVEGVDKQLGALLQILKEEGLLDNSLVVLFSDHGTAVGLPGDRLIEKSHYQGDAESLKLIPVNRLSSTSEFSTNYQRDYTINTAYGQGTNVLSLTQHHVLLAFRQFGAYLQPQQINELSSLVDIAPTIIDWLNLTPMQAIDGISLRPYFSNQNKLHSSPRALFMETGDSLTEIETDHIYIEKVFKREIGVYTINTSNGLLMMNPLAEKSIIQNKQRAIMWNNWLLARYPANIKMDLVSANKKNKSNLISHIVPAYFVLANLKTGQWTIGLSSPFAKAAPVEELMQQLRNFYGDEVLW